MASVSLTVTPALFDDPSVNTSSTSTSLSHRPNGSSKKKKRIGKHIPRPPNAFMLFRASFIKATHIPSIVGNNPSTLSTITGLAWKGLTTGQKKIWQDKAQELKDKHKKNFPGYQFQPVRRFKRKRRDVSPEDVGRCAKIAELWAQGKCGEELNDEIRNFDNSRTPMVSVRFAPPLTAQDFPRSPSQPKENPDSYKMLTPPCETPNISFNAPDEVSSQGQHTNSTVRGAYHELLPDLPSTSGPLSESMLSNDEPRPVSPIGLSPDQGSLVEYIVDNMSCDLNSFSAHDYSDELALPADNIWFMDDAHLATHTPRTPYLDSFDVVVGRLVDSGWSEF
ncbi:hypothetical protein CVT26_012927 [Gymnopilus dilepis]|uniref:HMG box domain-containing protein n=1 Tax=Gymnopilus dilepis TaxID=231916 RepID=A0A409WVK7_9AGAR|nr:hypothetical protein CVT26_012927 [Gymnopilus dilepis]